MDHHDLQRGTRGEADGEPDLHHLTHKEPLEGGGSMPLQRLFHHMDLMAAMLPDTWGSPPGG